MKRTYYLAYGSNLNVNQMLFRCPDAVKIGASFMKKSTRGAPRRARLSCIQAKKRAAFQREISVPLSDIYVTPEIIYRLRGSNGGNGA